MTVATYFTKLLKKEQITPDAWIFYFQKPFDSGSTSSPQGVQGRPFAYKPGQYIKMWMEIDNQDSRGITRYFTLTSAPSEEYLMVTTRILKSSFKKKLGSLQVGTRVKIRGPWGDFVVHESNTRPLVFLSGGIGITPFRSIIKYITGMGLDTRITLFSAYKTPDEILFNNELTEISSINKNIKIINTITQSENTHSARFDGASARRASSRQVGGQAGQAEWKGEVGRIGPEMLKKHLDKLTDYVYYIAGPDPLVDTMYKMLRGMKIPEKQILTDGFPGY